MILHHQDEHPFAAPLFRFAIFVNGSLPYSKTSRLGVDVSQIFHEAAMDKGKVFTPTDDDDISDSDDGAILQMMLPIRRFSPRTHKDRISIPTAHIFGKKDHFRLQSLQLANLCDSKQATCFEHSGAHDVPRRGDQSAGIAKAIMCTFEKAQFVSA